MSDEHDQVRDRNGVKEMRNARQREAYEADAAWRDMVSSYLRPVVLARDRLRANRSDVNGASPSEACDVLRALDSLILVSGLSLPAEPAADVRALVDAYGQAEREFAITLPVDFNGHRSAEQVADIAAARNDRDTAKSALLRALGIGEG